MSEIRSPRSDVECCARNWRINKMKKSAYKEFYFMIKETIQKAQIKAALSVNKELLNLYWSIGKEIVIRQKNEGWGNAVVEKLATDLKKDFPGLKGFSRANMFNMRQWYLFYSKADQKVQQLVGQLPWGHNVLLMNKIKDIKEIEVGLFLTK